MDGPNHHHVAKNQQSQDCTVSGLASSDKVKAAMSSGAKGCCPSLHSAGITETINEVLKITE